MSHPSSLLSPLFNALSSLLSHLSSLFYLKLQTSFSSLIYFFIFKSPPINHRPPPPPSGGGATKQ
ncbi:hypothetical protein HanIR_Chr15g0767251 [Helianthus annuus]|nr:hypothetical protein HanIR_Chr15g0767251 [Helianthus annuus]